MTVILTDMRFGFQCHALTLCTRVDKKLKLDEETRWQDRLWPFVSVTHCFDDAQ